MQLYSVAHRGRKTRQKCTWFSHTFKDTHAADKTLHLVGVSLVKRGRDQPTERAKNHRYQHGFLHETETFRLKSLTSPRSRFSSQLSRYELPVTTVALSLTVNMKKGEKRDRFWEKKRKKEKKNYLLVTTAKWRWRIRENERIQTAKRGKNGGSPIQYTLCTSVSSITVTRQPTQQFSKAWQAEIE